MRHSPLLQGSLSLFQPYPHLSTKPAPSFTLLWPSEARPSDTHRSPAPVVPDETRPTVAGLAESTPDSQTMLCPCQAHPPCPSDTHRSPVPVVPDGVWPTVAGLSESIPDSQAMLCPPQAHPLHPSDTHWSPAPVVPDETQPTFAGLPVPIPALPSPVHQTRTLLHLAVTIRGPSVRYSSVPSSRSSTWDTAHCCRAGCAHLRPPGHAVPTQVHPSRPQILTGPQLP